MRILVTGCAGFIGARVTEMMLERGDDVTGVDNLSQTMDRSLWKNEDIPFLFLRLDVTNRDQMRALWCVLAEERVDAVIHLAASTGVRDSVALPAEFMHVNAVGTTLLLDLCRAHGIPKFVLASTSSLYGITDGTPSKETDPVHALSPYAASKLGAEAACESAHHLHGIDVSILRYFTIYGPDGRRDMFVYRACESAVNGTPLTIYGDGSQSRDYTYIDDIARGTIAALKPVGCEVINLCAGHPVSLRGILDRTSILPSVCRHEEQSPADVPTTCGDYSKAAELLGWLPETGILDGMERTMAWHNEQANRTRRSTPESP